MQVVAGVDLGGTAVNYTLINVEEQFLIDGLQEHPARSKEGPEICLQQIVDGLHIAVEKLGLTMDNVAVVGLDTPGPASASGVAASTAPVQRCAASAASPLSLAASPRSSSRTG